MKIHAEFLVIANCLIVCSCASLQPILPKLTATSNYVVGDTLSAGIGDPIFDVQSALKVPEYVAIQSHDPGHIRFLRSLPKVTEGTHYRAYAGLEGGNLVLRSRSDSMAQMIVITPEGKALGFFDGKKGYQGGKWPDEPLFRPEESLEGQKDAFRAQMIYSGLDGNTVRATYREFSGDFIRPAFAQELQYNLAQDSTIAYKSIKIQVLQATNSQIRYKVVDDEGLKWLPNGGRH
jgi:hypothetical protein